MIVGGYACISSYPLVVVDSEICRLCKGKEGGDSVKCHKYRHSQFCRRLGARFNRSCAAFRSPRRIVLSAPMMLAR